MTTAEESCNNPACKNTKKKIQERSEWIMPSQSATVFYYLSFSSAFLLYMSFDIKSSVCPERRSFLIILHFYLFLFLFCGSKTLPFFFLFFFSIYHLIGPILFHDRVFYKKFYIYTIFTYRVCAPPSFVTIEHYL